MIAKLAVALFVMTAVPSTIPQTNTLSIEQKNAAMQAVVQRATDCIARTVTADERLQNIAVDVGDLVVDSMPTCLGPVQAMINGYDRYFGEGEGTAFFMGPYLDRLPEAIDKWAKSN